MLWPPSLTGSWESLTQREGAKGFYLTLEQKGDQISGTGSVDGHPLSITGVGNAENADLVLRFLGDWAGQELSARLESGQTARVLLFSVDLHNGNTSHIYFVRSKLVP